MACLWHLWILNKVVSSPIPWSKVIENLNAACTCTLKIENENNKYYEDLRTETISTMVDLLIV